MKRISGKLLFQSTEVFILEVFRTDNSETILKKKNNRPVFWNMNLVFLLVVCVNSLVDIFSYNYVACF